MCQLYYAQEDMSVENAPAGNQGRDIFNYLNMLLNAKKWASKIKYASMQTNY